MTNPAAPPRALEAPKTLTDITVFGVASDGKVPQWDGHATPIGILLRWFVRPELGYPQLGFDVYRGTLNDVPPLPFNDLNAPLVNGRTTWTYAQQVTLSCADGLQFEPTTLPGWWRLVIKSTRSPVQVQFAGPAWLIDLRADEGTTDLTVIGEVDGAEVLRAQLTTPGETLQWRNRGIDSLELVGDGSLSSIGYRLRDDPASWSLLAHRCLPVIDPAYPCRPQVAATAEDEARSRLPAPVAAEWPTRFAQSFANLLPALQRLATNAPAQPIPAAQGNGDVNLKVDEQTLIALSALDPHGARMLGLAYDDPLTGSLNGREYVYKVVGRWVLSPVRLSFKKDPLDRQVLQGKYGLKVKLRRGAGTVELVLQFPQAVHAFEMQLLDVKVAEWSADENTPDAVDGVLKLDRKHDGWLRLPRVQRLRIKAQLARGGSASSASAANSIVAAMNWSAMFERSGILPGIAAVDPGAPGAPTVLTAHAVPAQSPAAIVTASLDWTLPSDGRAALPENATVCYQLGRHRLADDPATQAPTPAAADTDLLYAGAPMYPAAGQTALAFGQRVLHTDRNNGQGLSAGRWAWWVRGVDLFGRVSESSPWAQVGIVDQAPPAAPVLVEAEWVQRAFPPEAVMSMGRSSEAARWLQQSQAPAGLLASWVFGPDQMANHTDVDGFELHLRRPPAPGLAYPDPWPVALARFGPTAVFADGSVTAVAVDPTLNVNLRSARRVVAAPFAAAAPTPRYACVTDVTLDGASGVFVGGTLTAGALTLPVLANGDGDALEVAVQHSAAPASGAAQLRAPTGKLLTITVNMPQLNPPAGLRARGGMLQVGSHRLPVLRRSANEFLCVSDGSSLASGGAVRWFPVWSVALDDTGFGPSASAAAPVAHAQAAVRAVRALQRQGPRSALSASLTVTAVYLDKPNPPSLGAFPFDPSKRCALLASRADWFGKSQFTLSWAAPSAAPAEDRRYIVYRALGDEINRLDRRAYTAGGRRRNAFPQAADFPPGVYADTTRRARVQAELTTLNAALGATSANTDAVDAAYAALTIDTQMLLARQDYVWPAFTALNSAPLDTSSFTDTLDGRSHGHWFYRVTCRGAGGMESEPCEPTPPICCPDVVPPAQPIVQMALAGPGFVKLRWLASPDADLDRYDIYAAQDPHAEAEIGSGLMPVATHAPSPNAVNAIEEHQLPRAAGSWCFWIVAVDTSGNRSAPSAMLRGASLQPPPPPPIWVSAQRAPASNASRIELRWRHDQDQRLSCSVERRSASGGYWVTIAPWLPRGVYSFDDTPPDISAGWEYRLQVRDHLDQHANARPSIAMQGL
jgi:hypothetical protein